MHIRRARPDHRLVFARRGPGRAGRNLNLDSAETLKDVLEMSGHEVLVAHDGREGVAKAVSFTPTPCCATSGCQGWMGTGWPTSRRILVVDDNGALRSNLRELLEKARRYERRAMARRR